MEERKTAAIVLSVVAFVIIFFAVILPEIRYRRTQTLSYKTCTVHFDYSKIVPASDTYRAANKKLALCLCSIYVKKPGTAVADQIINIYRQYGSHSVHDSISYNNNLDSILRNKADIFDPLILVD